MMRSEPRDDPGRARWEDDDGREVGRTAVEAPLGVAPRCTTAPAATRARSTWTRGLGSVALQEGAVVVDRVGGGTSSLTRRGRVVIGAFVWWAVALAALVTACGGGGRGGVADSSSSADISSEAANPSQSGPSLTKSEFLAEVNRLCRSQRSDVDPLWTAFIDDHPSTGGRPADADYEELRTKVLPILEEHQADLEAIVPPPEIAARWSHHLASVADDLAAYRADASWLDDRTSATGGWRPVGWCK